MFYNTKYEVVTLSLFVEYKYSICAHGIRNRIYYIFSQCSKLIFDLIEIK